MTQGTGGCVFGVGDLVQLFTYDAFGQRFTAVGVIESIPSATSKRAPFYRVRPYSPFTSSFASETVCRFRLELTLLISRFDVIAETL